MPPTLFCISIDPLQVTMVQSSAGMLTGLSIERDDRQLGSIYKGRVANVLPGMDAAFVDIGMHRNALLYLADVATLSVQEKPSRIQDVLKVGAEIVVQITRPAVGNKGARVSQRLSLAGRYLVLMTNSENIGVSKRIDSKEERDRLRRSVEKLRPLECGIIVRTEAEGAFEAQLEADIAELQKQFSNIALASQSPAPCVLYREMGIMGRLVRDHLNEGVSAILVDDHEEFLALQQLTQQIAPRFVDRIKYYDGTEPIFRRFGLEAEIMRARERSVSLPSGGHLTFDETEALTAIDVNTGRFTGKNRLTETVLATNLEAVEEAARQMQLRNIGGIVVIDFIDMDNTRDRVKIMNALEAALKNDHARTRIVQLSPLGLVEMTRRREGESLRQILHAPCPYCGGEGLIKSAMTVAIEARQRLRESLINANLPIANNATPMTCSITAHLDVAFCLIEKSSDALHSMEHEFSTPIFLLVDNSLHREAYQIDVLPNVESARKTFHLAERISSPRSELMPYGESSFFILSNKIIVFITGFEPTDSVDAQQDVPLEITEAGSLFARARVLANAS